jgi:hypothetical protein
MPQKKKTTTKKKTVTNSNKNTQKVIVNINSDTSTSKKRNTQQKGVQTFTKGTAYTGARSLRSPQLPATTVINNMPPIMFPQVETNRLNAIEGLARNTATLLQEMQGRITATPNAEVRKIVPMLSQVDRDIMLQSEFTKDAQRTPDKPMKSAMTRTGQTQQEIQPEEQQTDTPMSATGMNPIHTITPIKLESKFTNKWTVQPNELYEQPTPKGVDADTQVGDDLKALQLLHHVNEIRDEHEKKKKGDKREFSVADRDYTKQEIKRLQQKVRPGSKLPYNRAEEDLARYVVEEAENAPYPQKLLMKKDEDDY